MKIIFFGLIGLKILLIENLNLFLFLLVSRQNSYNQGNYNAPIMQKNEGPSGPGYSGIMPKNYMENIPSSMFLI